MGRKKKNNKENRQLLFSLTKKDFRVDWFSGKGGGGQKRNKTQNCCRIHHDESGAIRTEQSNKNRKNKIRKALQSLVKKTKFQIWHTKKCMDMEGERSIDEIVDDLMHPNNLKIEVWEDGEWREVDEI